MNRLRTFVRPCAHSDPPCSACEKKREANRDHFRVKYGVSLTRTQAHPDAGYRTDVPL